MGSFSRNSRQFGTKLEFCASATCRMFVSRVGVKNFDVSKMLESGDPTERGTNASPFDGIFSPQVPF